MDNITHSLMGIASAEILCQHSHLPQEKKDRFRSFFWIMSIIASNFPDLDVLYALFLGENGIGYLLHHRGHTHTFIMVPAQAAFLWGSAFLCLGGKKEIPRKTLFGVIFLALLLHITADSWNSYGVHPYWPWNNDWIYGDTFLIIEPWIWALLAPPIFFLTSSRKWQACVSIFLLGFLALAWFRSDIPVALALSLTIAVFLLSFAGWKTNGNRSLVIGIACCILVWLIFFQTRNKILHSLTAKNGTEISLSPYPGNPFCWYMIETSLTNAKYETRSSIYAPYPSLVNSNQCPTFLHEAIHEPLQKSSVENTPAQRNLKEFSISRFKFEEARMNCFVKAYFQFSRSPYWRNTKEGIEIGDLRFERIKNAWTFLFPKNYQPSECPKYLPPWKTSLHSPSLQKED